MSTRILLVTGSRVLAAADYEQRACTLLATFAEHYAPTIVVCGDAAGPDSWAASWATSTGRGLRIYALDGWVYDREMARCRRWHLDKTTAPTPLARNEAMVLGVAAQREHGARVEVFGLEAVWSSTRGTAHTLGKARAAGLPITRITFERGN